MKYSTFTITESYLKLAKRMFVSWNNGAPCIDSKRPYGNGDVIEDIKEIVGSELDDDIAMKLHREMETALQIFLCTQSFKVGNYEMTKMYHDLSWKLISEGKEDKNDMSII